MDRISAMIVLGLVFLGTLLPFLVHLVLARGLRLFRDPASRQKGAILSGPMGLIPLLILFSLLVPPRAKGGAAFWTAVYVFGAYACSSYVYFHFFNMSETARRIRILVHGASGGLIPAREIGAAYTPERMVAIRLERLVALKELQVKGGRYVIGGRGLLGLLLPARTVFGLRRFLFPGEKH
jgi:hypothetical protein